MIITFEQQKAAVRQLVEAGIPCTHDVADCFWDVYGADQRWAIWEDIRGLHTATKTRSEDHETLDDAVAWVLAEVKS